MYWLNNLRRLQTTQPIRGGAVTAVWQSALQIVSTPLIPNNGAQFTVFGASRSGGLAGWLALLLINTQVHVPDTYTNNPDSQHTHT